MESIFGFLIALAIASPVVMLLSMVIFPVWWIEYMDRECLNRLNKANKKLLDKLNGAKNTEQQVQPDSASYVTIPIPVIGKMVFRFGTPTPRRLT